MKEPSASLHARKNPSNTKVLSDILHRHAGEERPARPGSKPKVPVDIKQDASAVTVFADLPGVDEDDIHLKLHGSQLEITADREFDHDNEDAEDYLVLERAHGPLQRTVVVPENLDENEITAKYKRGVLKVRIPWIRGKRKS